MRNGRIVGSSCLIAVCALLVLAAQPSFAQPPCQVVDNGTGTVDLPPPGCGYLSPDDVHMIIDGLPPGTTIQVAVQHQKFFNIVRMPGGNLGGEIEQFQSILFMNMTGTGDLTGYNRALTLQVMSEVHTGPRTLGASPQTFPNEMVAIQGVLPPGDPDFDFLQITAGSAFSPPGSDNEGETTLTQLPNGHWNVDSFFDIVYRIDFQGRPGGPLSGMSGSTTGTIRMAAGTDPPEPPDCVQPDASGTVVLPPVNCGYVSPDDLHMILDGLPPGTDVIIGIQHSRFINIQTQPDPGTGGHIETFGSDLLMTMTGRGELTGYQRNLILHVNAETHTGPRTPGEPVQSFDTEMFRIQGQITGDPDFDLLRVTAGTGFGMPSPGHTTLTRLGPPGSSWNVDSFFDIVYRIDFQGAPGGPFGGMSGSTTGTIRMGTGNPAGTGCELPPGTDAFPSTAKIVVQSFFDPGSDPFIWYLSSAGLPDTVVQRGQQVGDTIQTEIVSLSLQGTHPSLGPINVHLDPDQPTLGEINNIQQSADCGFERADSFFDVFFEVDVSALGETWFPERPVRLENELTTLPPRREDYENPFLDPIVLRDRATGQPRGQLLYEIHRVDPPFDPGPVCMDTWLDLQLTVPSAGIFQEPLGAQGPSTVAVGPPFVIDGTCSDGSPCLNDVDCGTAGPCEQREAVQTEMTEMSLSSVQPHPMLGDYQIHVREQPPSLGLTQSESAHSTYPADSFFDVFVDIDTAMGRFSTSQQPVHVQAPIRNIPPDPGTPFQSPPGQMYPVFDEQGNPVGDIRNVVHQTHTPFDWQPPPPPDDDCFDSWLRLRITLFNPFCQEELLLPGDFRVLHDAPAPAGPPGQELIDTLIAKALFTGQGQCLGPLRVRLSQTNPSTGQVSSLAPAEFFPANSFFDVWAVVDTGIGTLFAASPVNMTTTINSLPPGDGEIYFGPGTVIPLLDSAGNQVGEILEVEHKVHHSVVCPPGCLGQWLSVAKGPGASVVLTAGIPDSGAGVQHDIARTTLSQLRSPGAPEGATWTCMEDNGDGMLTDLALPLLGDGFAYIARDAFGEYAGTWNSSSSSQSGDRDSTVDACTP